MCCGERGILQTNTTGMYGECSQCMDHTGFASTHGSMCFPSLHCSGYMLLCRGNCPKRALHFVHFPDLSCSGSSSWVLHKDTDWLGVRFVLSPGSSSSGNYVLSEHAVPGRLCILITSLLPAAWFPRSAARAPSQVGCVSPLESWSLAATLLANVNCAGSQEDLVSSCEPAHSLVEDAISLPSGSVYSPPASLPPA